MVISVIKWRVILLAQVQKKHKLLQFRNKVIIKHYITFLIKMHNYSVQQISNRIRVPCILVISVAWSEQLQSQPKVSGHPQTKALSRFPSFNVATMMSTFLSIFFWTCKTTLGRGYGGKRSHCPMLLSEIVWKSYVRYVVSFYVMLISTLLQSHVRARPVQRWRCTILNKIITAATAVKLHGNRCSLNHVDMNL